MGSFLLVYFIVGAVTVVPEQWTRVLEEKCPDLNANRMFEKAALTDMGFSLLLPFSYFAVLLDSQFFGGSAGINSVHSFWVRTARLVITFVVSWILYLPSYLIKRMDSLALLFLLRSALPSILMGLFLFLGLKFALLKMGLASRPPTTLRRKQN